MWAMQTVTYHGCRRDAKRQKDRICELVHLFANSFKFFLFPMCFLLEVALVVRESVNVQEKLLHSRHALPQRKQRGHVCASKNKKLHSPPSPSFIVPSEPKKPKWRKKTRQMGEIT
jgi:hypothetical protein